MSLRAVHELNRLRLPVAQCQLFHQQRQKTGLLRRSEKCQGTNPLTRERAARETILRERSVAERTGGCRRLQMGHHWPDEISSAGVWPVWALSTPHYAGRCVSGIRRSAHAAGKKRVSISGSNGDCSLVRIASVHRGSFVSRLTPINVAVFAFHRISASTRGEFSKVPNRLTCRSPGGKGRVGHQP
jgi:hypothetical protein